jgi:hypothetical protein
MDTLSFIEKSNIIWKGIYDYSLCSIINSTVKVKIICKIHGIFEQLPHNHYKYGCGKCRKLSTHNELLNKECSENFIYKANLVHNNKYDYSKCFYLNSSTKVVVTCSIHGDFLITPNNHLRSKGCNLCANIKRSRRKPFEDYLKIFKNNFGDKYDYSNIEWKGGSKYIDLNCKKHGQFKIFPYNHANGKECPKCSNCNYSKISIQWLDYLQIKYKIFIQHGDNIGEFYIPSIKYKADGYCKENNTIYEFLGDFWHGNPNIYDFNDVNPKNKKTFGELFNSTQRRKNEILKLGYNYIEIWENDWKKFIKNVIRVQRLWRKNY